MKAESAHARRSGEPYKEEYEKWKKTLFTWLGATAFFFVLYLLVGETGFFGKLFSAVLLAILIFGGIGIYLSKPKNTSETPYQTGTTSQRSLPPRTRSYSEQTGFQSRPMSYSYSYSHYQEERVSQKDKGIALLLCLFAGYFGVHYFYVGRFGMGLIYLFTGGLFFIGWIIDIFRIAKGSFRDSQGLELY